MQRQMGSVLMERQQNPAIKWGLIFGVLLILVTVANAAIQYATGTASMSSTSVASSMVGAALLQTCIVFLVEVALYFLAGMLTARANGRVGSAAIAGLIAGGLGVAASVVIAVIRLTTGSFPVPANANMSPSAYHSLVVVSIIVGLVFAVAIGLGIGAGVGALGGLAGRGAYERAHPAAPMTESYYTPTAPMGGYPPAYPPAGYPPAPGAVPPQQTPGAYPPPYPQYPQYPQYPPQTPEPPQQ